MKDVEEIGGKITDDGPVPEMKANLSPQFVRYSLKGLSKVIAVHHIDEILNQYKSRRNDIRKLENSLECDLLMKKIEFQSVKSMVDTNEKEIDEERDVLLALERKNHCDSSETARAYEKEKFTEILVDQKRMIDVNDTLVGIRRYNEEELNAAMDELNHLIGAKRQDILSEANLLSFERERTVICSSVDIPKEFARIRKCYEIMKRNYLKEIKSLEEEIKRINGKPKHEHSSF